MIKDCTDYGALTTAIDNAGQINDTISPSPYSWSSVLYGLPRSAWLRYRTRVLEN